MTDDERIKLETKIAYLLNENRALRDNNTALRGNANALLTNNIALREDVDNCDMYMSYVEELFYLRGVSLHTNDKVH
tara:strand:+ start:4210 stop:4440 length:231 start_codon:yes stop_codon:yes gene_type:complete